MMDDMKEEMKNGKKMEKTNQFLAKQFLNIFKL